MVVKSCASITIAVRLCEYADQVNPSRKLLFEIGGYSVLAFLTDRRVHLLGTTVQVHNSLIGIRSEVCTYESEFQAVFYYFSLIPILSFIPLTQSAHISDDDIMIKCFSTFYIVCLTKLDRHFFCL